MNIVFLRAKKYIKEVKEFWLQPVVNQIFGSDISTTFIKT